MSYDEDELLVEERSFTTNSDDDLGDDLDEPLEDLEPIGLDLDDDDDSDPDSSYH